MITTNPFSRYKGTHNILCISALAFVTIFVLLNPAGFTYDEPYYLRNIALFNEYGLSNVFLEKLAGPAGPTYAILHWLLQPITGLEVVPVRMVNIVLLYLSVFFIYLTLRKINDSAPWPKALALLCVPMVFVCAGMALTEMPALFFLTVAVYLLITGIQNDNYLAAVVGGICMSFAILGRQPYLLVLFAMPVFLYKNFSNLKMWIILALFFAASILLPMYAFYIWGGLVPHKGGDIATEHGLSPLNFFLSLGYAFMITLFLAPSWLLKIGKKEVVILSIAFIVAAIICTVANFSFPVMATVSKKILPGALYKYYGSVMGGALVTLGLYFVASAVFRGFGMLNDPVKLFFLLASLFILVSTLKITHQFSSRYVFQAAPLFILFLSSNINFKISDIALRLVALAIGIISLLSYF